MFMTEHANRFVRIPRTQSVIIFSAVKAGSRTLLPACLDEHRKPSSFSPARRAFHRKQRGTYFSSWREIKAWTTALPRVADSLSETML
jgi:hypothetical protein